MMPSNKHDPYQELEAYLRQAQAEVGRAVEDLLASESTGSSSSCAGSRKNSCPDLYSIGVADDSYRTPRKFVATYTSLSAPRPRRSVNGIGGSSSSEKVQSTAALVVTNGSRGRRASDGEPPTCAWDAYYGWESLQLSRPPSGDAQLLSIYTERLVEAVNGSFAEELFPLDDEGPSTERGSDAIDQSSSTVREATETSRISCASEEKSVSEVSVRGDGVENAESTAAAASTSREGSEFGSPRSTGDGESSADKKLSMVRSSSWPDLSSLRVGRAHCQPSTSLCGSSRAGSCPETSVDRTTSGVAPSSVVDIDSSQALSYDGSLYKNQQLYYESDEGGDGEEAKNEEPSMHDSLGCVKNAPAVEEFTEVELRISDSDHDDDEAAAGAALPELFIREDERDAPVGAHDHRTVVSAAAPMAAALRDSFTLDLRSPGLARSRLNPYTIEVIANHASSPDEVFATVSTLEARLASRPLPPLVIDENEPDTGTWSSTSTAHSASTVSRHELEEFLKSVEPPHDPPSWPQDAVTQTTPGISRSSSFTCVTECGEELGSSKESLAAVHNDAKSSSKTQHTLAVATQSPSPVSNSSSSTSCDAPPTPLTPRASPSSQEVVSSDLSDSAAHGTATVTATVARPLQNGSSPSLPALDGRECAQMSTHRQQSLEEKPQIRSLSRPTTKAADKKSLEATSTLPWTAPQQLSHKASSAPVLLKNRPPTSLGDSGAKTGLVPDAASAGSSPEEEVKAFPQARSQSAKDIKEVEAVHACEWLRQAGFPQYVQMYEDNNFPVEITTVLRDHPSLDPDELQSLFRRLNTLNKSARLKSDGLVKQSMHHDSDEEEGPALSYNWQFHRSSRRWSRVSPPLPVVVTPTGGSSRNTPQHATQQTAEAYSSHDSVFLDEPRSSPESRLSTSDERLVGADLEGSPGPKLRRSGSERIRDAILRRMDSLRGNRRRKKRAAPNQGPGAGNDPTVGGGGGGPWSNHLGPESHALSDSECSPQLAHRRKGGSFRSRHKNQQPPARWLSASTEHGRVSIYDNVPAGEAPNNQSASLQQQQQQLEQDQPQDLQQQQEQQRAIDTGSVGSGSTGRGVPEENDRPTYTSERRDSGVGSSLTRAGNGSPCTQGSAWHCFSSSPEQLTCMTALRYEHLSASQLLVLKKLALLHLTALMERFSPPYRSGWGWAVPKFIKRMRAPDYKDKTVFGVPLSVSLQRTGHALPPSIQGAMEFLRKSAPEATGLFRKSGVRSRIQKLRSLHESAMGPISYEQHQAYDVADLLKQYFRELPDGLLTSKLSDTFLCIFQHIPEELRLDALQAAVLLIPDENREVLETLLVFLDDVCRHAQENQMTVANIAVCIAPSLFQLAVPRSASASPRRRATTVGIPDQRELNENRAAHECLARMIVDHKKLFQISLETLQQCRLEQYEPMTLDELGSLKSYLEGCLHALITEAREKSKGWANVQHADVDLAFKKPGDGLPLRLWRCVVEVEAPPVELLTRILRERHIWDNTLIKWRHIARLDKQSEIIQYICGSMRPHAPRDFCVLRAWRTELARGSCALVELSVNHPDATVLLRGVRAVVLASRYLIEPCGAGKSRVTHISRVDFRGRTPDWYNKVYGHLCALLLVRLRDSFVQRTEGPETKV
ncbi:rho GTPase-activating protein 7 [Rhipicephalus sanguineus]|uniref:rho GTPase-activating protein 7 n=1 Tax=Rhipicephalus sanguineus TaxID=34632 RepID=UPI0018942DDA|nr:rho GTPase-activating protein 7 [Rhipicephalus sanguineus]